jgi:putative N6-adenine-specific DNA methylase
MNITVTCSKRITPFLEKEIQGLGYSISSKSINSIHLEGDMVDCMKLNYHIRCGNQVLLEIAQVVAKEPKELYNELIKIDWDKYIARKGYFSVVSTGFNEHVDNFMYVNQLCKDAIADFFYDKYDERPDSGSDKHKLVIRIHWDAELATVYIDTSGETLTKHNYRKANHDAPMQEALAAAVIYASNWDQKSNVVNPMCGSGTLAIEAALIASKRFPGGFRNNYSFMHVLGFDEDAWEAIRKEGKQQYEKPEIKIIASDISETALDAARRNAQTAGVDHMIEFVKCDFRETEVPENGGVILINPEYGERLGKIDELVEIYAEIGNWFKQKCAGYTGYVFTGNLDLAKKIGLKPKRRIEFYNGKIDCRLMEFELYAGSKRPPLVPQNI